MNCNTLEEEDNDVKECIDAWECIREENFNNYGKDGEK